MAFSKANNFSPELHHFSLVCKALSHPARVQMIMNLADLKGTYYSVLTHGIPLKKSTIQNHIRVLREMNILLVEERHPSTYYKLNHKLAGTTFQLLKLALRAQEKLHDEIEAEISFIQRRSGIQKDVYDFFLKAQPQFAYEDLKDNST